MDVHLIAALLGDGQRGHGGGGGKGEGGSREDLLEEAKRGHIGKDLHGQAVDQDRVQDVADVGGQQHQAEGAEDFRALRGNDPDHQREHAIGRQFKDEAHDALRDFVEGADEIAEGLALLAGNQNAAAEDDGDEDDLQHGRGGQRVDEVVRENIDDGVHEVGALGLVGRALLQFKHGEAALEEIGHDQAEHAGDRRCHQEVGHRLPADLADLLDVVHGNHAVHDAQQHQRNDNELQQVDEDVAKGLDVLRGERAGRFRAHGQPENSADNDTEHQADQNLHAQVHFLFHKRTILPSPKFLNTDPASARLYVEYK